MSVRLDQSWCPSCKEWTVLDAGRPCAWCDTILVRRRGGWKRPDQTGRISETQARALHLLYQQGRSLNKIAELVWERLGYASRHSCQVALHGAFKRHGLPRRAQVEATRLAVTTDGLSPKDWRERSRRRRAAGLTTKDKQQRQPLCAAVRSQYPRLGEPCSRPAARGSLYCVSHDPERREQRAAHLARMRAARATSPRTRGGNRAKETGQFATPS